jgi:subfamily B ATP-binding cassette protein MsbA
VNIWVKLLRRRAKTMFFALLAVIGESLTDIAQPWPLKIVLDNVLRQKSAAGHGWLDRWVVAHTGGDPWSALRLAVTASIVIAVVGAACYYAEKYLTTSVGQWVMHDLRLTLYAHVQRLSLSYHDQSKTGDLISRVTSDIDNVQSFLASGLLGVVINILTLGGMVAVMFWINWRFTLIALSIVPVLALVVFSYTRRIKQASRDVRKKEGEIVSVIQEVLTSIRVVKAFSREEYEQKRLEEESLESVEIALRARSLKARLSPIVEVIVAIGTALVLWFGASMAIGGALSAGSLVVFLMYLSKMYKPMQELSKTTDAYSKAVVGYERIQEILEQEFEVADTPGARKPGRLRGEIEFEHVSFHYKPEAPVLRDISFRIEPGQTVALVGPTGAGKSTIASLVPRFYDPTSGVVKIDGRDIKTLRLRSLREQISFVLQETALFHGPVWTNIAYGKPGASRAEILKAAEVANAHEFIEKMPEGYNSILGERGITLSGGQRQRIAIARAVIRNSPILILDEPSSGLDAESEHLVFEALHRLMEGRTAIVIAHRYSTIRNASRILVVEDGRICESGTHEELLHAGGTYAKLYELQFRDEAEAASEVGKR